jgi:hypothetical protein
VSALPMSIGPVRRVSFVPRFNPSLLIPRHAKYIPAVCLIRMAMPSRRLRTG